MASQFPEFFTDTQRELTNAMMGLSIIASKAMESYEAEDLAMDISAFALEFAVWVTRQGLVDEDEMDEIMEFMVDLVEEARKTMLLEELFEAPSFGEELEEDF